MYVSKKPIFSITFNKYITSYTTESAVTEQDAIIKYGAATPIFSVIAFQNFAPPA